MSRYTRSIWTDERVGELKRLVSERNTSRQIAKIMGCSPQAVRSAAARYGTSFNPYGRVYGPVMAPLIIEVAERHGVTVEDLKGPSRARKYSWARQEFMALATASGKSMPDVGRFLGGRDHSTVHHGIGAHKARMALLELQEAA